MSATPILDSHTFTDRPPEHHGEEQILDMLHEDSGHGHDGMGGGVRTDVARVAGDVIEHANSQKLTKAKPQKTPSRAMTAMKNRVGQMTAPITKPIKKVMTSIQTRAMQLIDQMKHGEHLSMKQLALIFAAPGGALILVHHYAKMFSKKAESAIMAGKKQWEGFLHSLGIASDASVLEIAHAGAEHTDDERPVIAPVNEMASVGHHHTEAANDSHGSHAHRNLEQHPDQERHAA